MEYIPAIAVAVIALGGFPYALWGIFWLAERGYLDDLVAALILFPFLIVVSVRTIFRL